MRVAGGVIAIVVGVIQTILVAIAVLFVSAVDTALQSEEAQQALADAQATEEGAAAAAAVSEAAGALGWIAWVMLIISILVVVLGIMICASKSPTNGMIVGIIGVVLLVLSIIQGGDIILPIIWNGLIILAGVLGYMGAKQDSTAPAT